MADQHDYHSVWWQFKFMVPLETIKAFCKKSYYDRLTTCTYYASLLLKDNILTVKYNPDIPVTSIFIEIGGVGCFLQLHVAAPLCMFVAISSRNRSILLGLLKTSGSLLSSVRCFTLYLAPLRQCSRTYAALYSTSMYKIFL